MGSFEQLKAAIASVIRQNGNQEITGPILQSSLLAMVNSLGAADYKGIATITTTPGVPDGKVWYIALTPGVYVNFNAVSVVNVSIIDNVGGQWVVTDLGISTPQSSGYATEMLGTTPFLSPLSTTTSVTLNALRGNAGIYVKSIRQIEFNSTAGKLDIYILKKQGLIYIFDEKITVSCIDGYNVITVNRNFGDWFVCWKYTGSAQVKYTNPAPGRYVSGSFVFANDNDIAIPVQNLNGTVGTLINQTYALTVYGNLAYEIEGINNIIKKLDINNIINSFSNYNIVADPQGWVYKYESDNQVITIQTSTYLDSNLFMDINGWVIYGSDWKNREINTIETNNIIPNIYNIKCDYYGNVIEFYKTWSSKNTDEILINDMLRNSFTNEVAIIKGTSHYGFPGICAGKSGVLHAFYRKALYHTGIDGDVMYSYSKDYGKTWSGEVIALAGGDETPDGYFGDWRDSKAIRLSNGKFILSQSKGYAKENGGNPPYHVDYDMSKYKTYAIIYSQLPNGVLDIDNPQLIELPKPNDVSYIFGAGGIMEYDNILYYTVYGNTPNSCFLYKSVDFGLTWQYVSKIQDGYNENSIAFMGNEMYCIMRAINGNARIVKSLDFGLTWELVKDLNTYYHGMYSVGFGDTIMVMGRAYDGKAFVVYFDKKGNFVLEPFAFGTSGDSSYSDICTLENYVHVIYYAQLSGTDWGIFTRKVERNKLFGLSY